MIRRPDAQSKNSPFMYSIYPMYSISADNLDLRLIHALAHATFRLRRDARNSWACNSIA